MTKLFGNRAGRLMKTDVREGEKSWELDVELPGFRKENISATLKDGYLTISAEKAVEETQEAEKKGQCVRRERWSGALSRAFYVGEGVTEEDVKAKYENGVLEHLDPEEGGDRSQGQEDDRHRMRSFLWFSSMH